MRLSSGWGFSDQLSFFTLYYNRGVPEYVLAFFTMKLPYNSKGVLSDIIASDGVRLSPSSALKGIFDIRYDGNSTKIDFVLYHLELNIWSETGWFAKPSQMFVLLPRKL